MMTMTMEPKEGMMIIMKRNELWQNGFYVDGDDGSAADNDNRDLTKLRMRRQRERQKTIGLMSKTTTLHVHHAFFYISLSSLHNYDVKWPILRSLENGNGCPNSGAVPSLQLQHKFPSFQYLGDLV